MDTLTLKLSFNSFYINPRTRPFSSAHRSFLRFAHLTTFKASTLCFSCGNNLNSNPKSTNDSFSFNPFWFLVPLLKHFKALASSQSKKWVSLLQAHSQQSEKVVNEYGGNYLQSGGFGLALLSLTSDARVRISPFLATLAANRTFLSGLFSWFFAQSMKVILNFFVERKWDFKTFFACGGMPSSHSALCTALTTSVALCHGVADSLFPVCLGFSLIVMYDAIGVRRHAGMQAEVLNMIVEDLFQGHPISQRKLKELLGHTPSQVLAGAVLGILVACACCQGCLVVT